MTKYNVAFSYSYPEWGEIELDAETLEEARAVAEKEIEDVYPEALDIEIESVTELSNG